MDGGSFYSSRNATNRFLTSNPLALSPGADRSHVRSGTMLPPSHRAPSDVSIAIGQKLDRLITLVEAQGAETANIKADVANLRSEVDAMRSVGADDSQRERPTSTSVKLPLELSVSSIWSCY